MSLQSSQAKSASNNCVDVTHRMEDSPPPTCPARALILKANFQLKAAQLSGGPDWISTERFDISAKTADQSISDDDLALSLQPLLVDRFHLKFHRETRQEPVLALVTDKVKPGAVPHAGAGEPSMRTSMAGGKASLKASNVSMTKLASRPAGFTGRVVLDKPAQGRFRFQTDWAAESSRRIDARLHRRKHRNDWPLTLQRIAGAVRLEAATRYRTSRSSHRRCHG